MSAGESRGRGGEEERLERLFRTLNAPCTDDEFTDTVMRRVIRGGRMRRLVLVSAAALGLLLSIVAISRGVTLPFLPWQALADTTDWRALLATDASPVALALLLLIAPVAARWLAR